MAESDHVNLEHSNPLMATKGHVPVPDSEVIVISGIANAVEVAVENKWNWLDSNMEKKKMPPRKATMSLKDKGELEGHVPLMIFAPDAKKHGLNPERLVHIRYQIGTNVMSIQTPRRAIPIMKARINEYLFKYSDQCSGKSGSLQ